MVFGRTTVFAAAEDVATVITVITYYYCFYQLVMPPKRATTGRAVGLGKVNKKTPTPTTADDESSHDEHDDGAAGSETKVHTDLNEEEEAIAGWLGDHPELYNKKLNAYKDKVKKDAALLSRQPYLISQ